MSAKRSACACASLLKAPLRSSSAAASDGNCKAALSAERLLPKVKPPSMTGDTMAMPDTMMP